MQRGGQDGQNLSLRTSSLSFLHSYTIRSIAHVALEPCEVVAMDAVEFACIGPVTKTNKQEQHKLIIGMPMASHRLPCPLFFQRVKEGLPLECLLYL